MLIFIVFFTLGVSKMTRDCVKMTPDRVETIRALSLHWNQTEIAALIGCAHVTIGTIQRKYAMPRMSVRERCWRSKSLWFRMWGHKKEMVSKERCG